MSTKLKTADASAETVAKDQAEINRLHKDFTKAEKAGDGERMENDVEAAAAILDRDPKTHS